MRRFVTYVIAVAVAGSAVVVAQKVQTPEELDKAMKRIPPAQGATNKAIQSMAYADAKKQLKIVQDALENAHNFWVVKKKDDAIKMSKDAIDKADALEDLLEESKPDQQKVVAAFKQFAGSCASCHMAYRAQDANQQYILKPGSI